MSFTSWGITRITGTGCLVCICTSRSISLAFRGIGFRRHEEKPHDRSQSASWWQYLDRMRETAQKIQLNYLFEIDGPDCPSEKGMTNQVAKIWQENLERRQYGFLINTLVVNKLL